MNRIRIYLDRLRKLFKNRAALCNLHVVNLGNVSLSYVIDGEWLELTNPFGIICRYPISRIREIRRPRRVVKPPVISLRGAVQVIFADGRNPLVLWPDNPEEFLEELREVNPAIKSDIL